MLMFVLQCCGPPSREAKWRDAVPKVLPERKPIPQKNEKGRLVFEDYPNFTPNLTPKEVICWLGLGSGIG